MWSIFILLITNLISIFGMPQNYYQQPQQYPSTNTKQPAVPIVSESNEMNPDGSFSYSYATGDGQQAEARGYLKYPGVKDQEAEIIEGSYSYTSPEGIPITVTYIADENGFRAEGAHLPTPPPIPEEIKKSLEIIAKTQKIQPHYLRHQHQQQQQQPYYRPRPLRF